MPGNAGTGFCTGWGQWKADQELRGAGGSGVGDDGNAEENSHPGVESLATAEAMHDWWCSQQPGRSETMPCRQHHFVQQHKFVCGEGGRSAECIELEREHESYMQGRQNRVRDQEHDREMHDAWCAMPGNAGTGFCRGWGHWKEVHWRKDRDEL
mmetsp:Transcript_45951/g.98008  ORF Transcript_45951/g.98008 Transcript_45951/m.98008 type:complete len:154 (-) Transcript_45951:95-556(-)